MMSTRSSSLTGWPLRRNLEASLPSLARAVGCNNQSTWVKKFVFNNALLYNTQVDPIVIWLEDWRLCNIHHHSAPFHGQHRFTGLCNEKWNSQTPPRDLNLLQFTPMHPIFEYYSCGSVCSLPVFALKSKFGFYDYAALFDVPSLFGISESMILKSLLLLLLFIWTKQRKMYNKYINAHNINYEKK